MKKTETINSVSVFSFVEHRDSSGLFTTIEEQPDGSKKYFLHNKPILSESDIVWSMTAEAWGVSTDGGKSWNAGITVNGEVIASILNTIGLNFDWGVGGTLVIQNRYGDVTFSANSETGEVFVNGTIRSEVEGGVGREWIEINEAVISGGVDDEEYGIIDLCANYGDSYKHLVAGKCDYLHLQASEKINIESIADFHEQAVFWVASKMYYLSHVSSGGHIVFASDGQTLAYLASSSKKYKDHVRDLTDEEAEKLLNARVVWFKYKENYLDKDDPMNGKEIPGFYAEELEEISPELIQYNNKGEAEDWNYRTMIPLMVKIIEKQQNEINELKNEISKIKETIGGLS